MSQFSNAFDRLRSELDVEPKSDPMERLRRDMRLEESPGYRSETEQSARSVGALGMASLQELASMAFTGPGRVGTPPIATATILTETFGKEDLTPEQRSERAQMSEGMMARAAEEGGTLEQLKYGAIKAGAGKVASTARGVALLTPLPFGARDTFEAAAVGMQEAATPTLDTVPVKIAEATTQGVISLGTFIAAPWLMGGQMFLEGAGGGVAQYEAQRIEEGGARTEAGRIMYGLAAGGVEAATETLGNVVGAKIAKSTVGKLLDPRTYYREALAAKKITAAQFAQEMQRLGPEAPLWQVGKGLAAAYSTEFAEEAGAELGGEGIARISGFRGRDAATLALDTIESGVYGGLGGLGGQGVAMPVFALQAAGERGDKRAKIVSYLKNTEYEDPEIWTKIAPSKIAAMRSMTPDEQVAEVESSRQAALTARADLGMSLAQRADMERKRVELAQKLAAARKRKSADAVTKLESQIGEVQTRLDALEQATSVLAADATAAETAYLAAAAFGASNAPQAAPLPLDDVLANHNATSVNPSTESDKAALTELTNLGYNVVFYTGGDSDQQDAFYDPTSPNTLFIRAGQTSAARAISLGYEEAIHAIQFTDAALWSKLRKMFDEQSVIDAAVEYFQDQTSAVDVAAQRAAMQAMARPEGPQQPAALAQLRAGQALVEAEGTANELRAGVQAMFQTGKAPGLLGRIITRMGLRGQQAATALRVRSEIIASAKRRSTPQQTELGQRVREAFAVIRSREQLDADAKAAVQAKQAAQAAAQAAPAAPAATAAAPAATTTAPAPATATATTTTTAPAPAPSAAPAPATPARSANFLESVNDALGQIRSKSPDFALGVDAYSIVEKLQKPETAQTLTQRERKIGERIQRMLVKRFGEDVTSLWAKRPPRLYPELAALNNRYESGIGGDYMTAEDLADEIEGLDDSGAAIPPAVLDAVKAYRTARGEESGEFGERGGTDVDAADALEQAVAEASSERAEPIEPPAPATAVTLEARKPRQQKTVDLMEADPVSARESLGLVGQIPLTKSGTPTKAGANKTRDVGLALSRRTVRAGMQIGRKDYSDRAANTLASSLASEVEYHLTNSAESGTGEGWYSTNWPNAVSRLAAYFPELVAANKARKAQASARQYRAVLTAFIAIYSNGEKVSINLNNAIAAYGKWRSGKAPSSINIGSRRDMESGLAAIEEVLSQFGMEGFESHLRETMTVREINKALREKGEDAMSDYPADATLPLAAFYFGAKLGAFYANLMGDAGYLTMDLWWCRTFNRMRGQLKTTISPQQLEAYRKKMGLPSAMSRAAILKRSDEARKPYEARNFQSRLEQIMGRKAGKNAKERAKFEKDAKAKLGSKFVALFREHSREKASNTIAKNAFDQMEEAPFGAADRAFMIDVVRRVQGILEERGLELTIADIQAAAWYYEKDLYAKLTGKSGERIGYAEGVDAWIAERKRHGNRPFGRLVRGMAQGVQQPSAKGASEADGRVDEGRSVRPEQRRTLLALDARRVSHEARPQLPVGFYSALIRGVDSLVANSMSADGWKQQIKMLTNRGLVKQTEVEWSGINEWLDTQPGKVEKATVAEWLAENGVSVQVLRFTDKARRPNLVKRYSEYVRETYVDEDGVEQEGTLEHVTTLYDENTDHQFEIFHDEDAGNVRVVVDGVEHLEVKAKLNNQRYEDAMMAITEFLTKTPKGFDGRAGFEEYRIRGAGSIQKANYRELTASLPDVYANRAVVEPYIYEQHMLYKRDADINRLYHIRMEDRQSTDGKKILFVIEIQSDWAQNIRRGERMEGGARADVYDRFRIVDIDTKQVVSRHATDKDAQEEFARRGYGELDNLKYRVEEFPPDAPFVGTTDAWLALALKQILLEAKDGGYDMIAFAKGNQVNNMFGSVMSGARGNGNLKFYDEILPAAISKLMKKMGGPALSKVQIKGAKGTQDVRFDFNDPIDVEDFLTNVGAEGLEDRDYGRDVEDRDGTRVIATLDYVDVGLFKELAEDANGELTVVKTYPSEATQPSLELTPKLQETLQAPIALFARKPKRQESMAYGIGRRSGQVAGVMRGRKEGMREQQDRERVKQVSERRNMRAKFKQRLEDVMERIRRDADRIGDLRDRLDAADRAARADKVELAERMDQQTLLAWFSGMQKGNVAGYNQAKKDMEQIRREVVSIIAMLPQSMRGSYNLAIATMKQSDAGVLKISQQVVRDLATADAIDVVNQIVRTRKRVKKAGMRNETRASIDANLDAAQAMLTSAGRRLKEFTTSADLVQRTNAANALLEQAFDDYDIERREYREGRTEMAEVAAQDAAQFADTMDGVAGLPAEPLAERAPQRTIPQQVAIRNADAYTLMEKLEGSQSGIMGKIWDTLAAAKDTMFKARREIDRSIEAALRAAGYAGYDGYAARAAGLYGDASAETTVVRMAGQDVTMSVDKMLNLAALDPDTVSTLTDEQNPDQPGSGIVFDTNRQATPIKFTQQEHAALVASLTPQQKQLIDEMKNILEQRIRPDVFEIHFQQHGRQPPIVDRYFPRYRLGTEVQELGIDSVNMQPGQVVQTMLSNAGFLNKRVQSRASLVISGLIRVMDSHVDESLRVIHLSLALRYALTVMRSAGVRANIERILGDKGTDLIRKMLLNGVGLSGKPVGDIVENINANIAGANLTINPKTWLRQLGGIARLYTEMSTAAFAAGMASVTTMTPGTRAEMARRVEEANGYFYERHRRSQVGIFANVLGDPRQGTEQWSNALAAVGRAFATAGNDLAAGRFARASRDARQGASAFTRIIRSADMFLRTVDRQVMLAAFAGYRSELSRTNPSMTSDELDMAAAKMAEAAFRRTQNVSDPLDDTVLAAEGKFDRGITRFLFPYSSDPLKGHNQLRRAFSSRDPEKIAKATAGVGMNMLWSAAVNPAWAAAFAGLSALLGGDDDEDEKAIAAILTEREMKRIVARISAETAAQALGYPGTFANEVLNAALLGFSGAAEGVGEPLVIASMGELARSLVEGKFLEAATTAATMSGIPVAAPARAIAGALPSNVAPEAKLLTYYRKLRKDRKLTPSQAQRLQVLEARNRLRKLQES